MPKLKDANAALQRPWAPHQPGMYALNGAHVRLLRRKALLRQMDVGREMRMSSPIIVGIEHDEYLVNQHVAELLAVVLTGDIRRWHELLAASQPDERSA